MKIAVATLKRVGVAKMPADKEVAAVAAGKFGPNMADALKERGIRVYEMKGTAKEAPTRIASFRCKGGQDEEKNWIDRESYSRHGR